jgi:NADP-dependent 3-hydroxy acid dehydrogenase YdfG
VVATARDVGRLAELTRGYSNRVLTVKLDVSDPDAAQEAVKAAVKTFGRLDVLVNNARYAKISPFEQTSPEEFKSHSEQQRPQALGHNEIDCQIMG